MARRSGGADAEQLLVGEPRSDDPEQLEAAPRSSSSFPMPPPFASPDGKGPYAQRALEPRARSRSRKAKRQVDSYSRRWPPAPRQVARRPHLRQSPPHQG